MCDEMKKYKDTHLKLANDEKVDIIYSSSKESTILKMPECAEDKELVNKDSSFFSNFLTRSLPIFFHPILG